MTHVRTCPRCQLRDRDPSHERCLVCGVPLIETGNPRLGITLAGRYRLEEVIGEGGMATVYRAKHALLDRHYAVKILHRNLARDERLVERMRREARSTAALTHPNIVAIHDFGRTDDGAPYLVMELLEGQPLRALLRGEPLPLSDVLELGGQMAAGLARAHDFGIIHRDVKPENVFVLEEDGQRVVKLVDFGLARSEQDTRLTNLGEVIGTPQYMAPERALSRDVTPACDLYSLGVVLFEMATGALPFQSNTPSGFVFKHIHEPPPRPRAIAPSVAPALEALILELLAKDPTQRPVDAHRVVERLHAIAPNRARISMRPSKASPEPRTTTTSVDAWIARASRFEQALRELHEDAPSAVAQGLDQVRGDIERMRALADQGRSAQRELDALAAQAREESERLGHAVHELAKDLSRAREAVRSARAEANARMTSVEPARDAWQRAFAELSAVAGSVTPPPDLDQRTRALSAAAAGWRSAHG